MNTKKISIASIVVIVLIIIAGIGFTVGHKSTAEKLQAQEWTLTNNNYVHTANFTKNNELQVRRLSMEVDYRYKLYQSNKKDFIKIYGKDALDNKIKYTYEINETDNGYYLKLIKNKTNNNALNDTDDFVGDIKLEPKND